MLNAENEGWTAPFPAAASFQSAPIRRAGRQQPVALRPWKSLAEPQGLSIRRPGACFPAPRDAQLCSEEDVTEWL